jgi:hypothetical protein
MHVRMYVYTNICTCKCIYVLRTCVCMYVRIYVCIMYVPGTAASSLWSSLSYFAVVDRSN